MRQQNFIFHKLKVLASRRLFSAGFGIALRPHFIIVLVKLFSFSLLCIGTLPLVAQTNGDTTQLKEVVIIENRFQSFLKNTPQHFTRVNAEQLNALPLRSLAEALAYVPGVDIRQRGVFGLQADIGIRGGSFEQTLLLINGMKITDPQTGHHTMNLPLPLFSVQQMDVLKGPAARIYGQNAFAGAVNIITNLPAVRSTKAQVFGGDFNLYGANIFLAMPYKKWRQSISASASQNADYRYNTAAKQASALYESQLQINQRNSLRAMAAVSTRSMGANGFYSDKYPDQWESTSTLFAALSFSHHAEKSTFQIKNYYRINNDEFRLKKEQPSFYTNTHRSFVAALEANGSTKSKFGQSGYGIDLRNEQIVSSNLGTHQRDLLGVYLEHKLQLARFTARAGLYGNYYKQYGLHYFPGAELGYQLKTNHFLYTNWGYSFRIPTYTELYYKDPVTSSNSNLLPEKAQSIELGYRYNTGQLLAELNVFNRATRNLIDYVKANEDNAAQPNLWTPNNFTRVNFIGFEAAASYNFKKQTSEFFFKSVSLSYNYIDASVLVSQTMLSRYSLNQLKQQAVAGVEMNFLRRIDLYVKARYCERQNAMTYFLLDAKLSCKLKNYFSLFAECSNITNKYYIETGWVQMPGRWTRAGLNFTL